MRDTKPPAELLEIAKELKSWSESVEGRRELAAMMEKVRQTKEALNKERRIDPKDLHDPFTL